LDSAHHEDDVSWLSQDGPRVLAAVGLMGGKGKEDLPCRQLGDVKIQPMA
jgi:hypothetical protein